MPFRTNKSIRFKFTFIFTLFVAIILCLFSTILYTLHTHQIRQNIEKSLSFAIEQSIQNFFDQHGNFHFHEQNDSNKISQFIAIRIYDNKKLLHSSHNISQPNTQYPISKHIEIENGKFLVLAMPFKQYVIQGFYLQTGEIEKLHDLVLILVFLAIGCIFCSAIGAWYLSFRLLAPFRQIAQNASRISAENLNEELKFSVENDEIGQLCITLNSLFVRLQNSFESLKKFTSNASHELKTPLTIMRGDIEVLLRRQRTSQEYEQTLFCTIGEIDRMHRLIQGLLLLAQAEGEKTVAKTSQIFLPDIIEVTKNNLVRIHENADIRIEEDIDHSVYVYGNPIWIQQVIENLLNNAFQNTPAKGMISLVLQKSKECVEFSIKNSGEGIAAEHIPFIFDRFYRVKSAKAHSKGFGLGLAICKALVEKHKGRLEVTSIYNKETTFVLLLPLE